MPRTCQCVFQIKHKKKNYWFTTTVSINLRRPTLFLESCFNLWHSSLQVALLCQSVRVWHAVSDRLIFMKL